MLKNILVWAFKVFTKNLIFVIEKSLQKSMS